MGEVQDGAIAYFSPASAVATEVVECLTGNKDDEESPARKLLWDNEIKGYDREELIALEAKVGESLQWFQDNNLYSSIEDVVAVRVGIPYIGSDATITADTIYDGTSFNDGLIRSVGVDMVKITKRDASSASTNRQLTSYSYKSKYIHRIFGDMFTNGVDNSTGLGFLDNAELILTNVSSVPIEYDGVVQLPTINYIPVPQHIIDSLTYISQNPKLASGIVEEPSASEKGGDLMYFTAKRFCEKLEEIKANSEAKFATIVPENLQDMYDLTEYCELDSAFKQVDYGGDISNIRISIKIPASRASQEILERLLGVDENGDQEVFSNIFKEQWYSMSDKDVENSSKTLDLIDEYSASSSSTIYESNPDPTAPDPDKHTYENYKAPVISDSGEVATYIIDGPYYGCKRTTVIPATVVDGEVVSPEIITYDYRHFHVSKEWLANQSAEVASIVFWMGFDISIPDPENNCGLVDKVLITVIIIVLAVISFFSAGTLAPWAVAIAQALIIASAVISVGLVWGVFGTGMLAKRMAQLNAIIGVAIIVVSISSALGDAANRATLEGVVAAGKANGATTAAKIAGENAAIRLVAASSSIFKHVMELSISAVTGYMQLEGIEENWDFQKDVERISNQLDQLNKDAEEFEASIIVSLSQEEEHISVGLGDPEKHITDQLSKFTLDFA